MEISEGEGRGIWPELEEAQGHDTSLGISHILIVFGLGQLFAPNK